MNPKPAQKDYDQKRSRAEEVLMRMLESGRLKEDSEECRKRCEYIDHCADMASRLADQYDRND